MSTTDEDRAREAVAAEVPAAIGEIQSLIRLPQSGPGLVTTTVPEIERQLRDVGATVLERFETPENPMIYARIGDGTRSGLIVHLMYDTWPVTDADDWAYGPFEGAIADFPVGRVIVGRGTYARRGALGAFLSVLRALKRVAIPLPVDLHVILDGNEVDGSPHLAAFYERYRERMTSARGTLFPSATQAEDGSVPVRLSAKGFLSLELACDAARWGRGPMSHDLYWAECAWIESPIWRLTHAVSTLASADGMEVQVEGFHDDVVPPTAQDLELLDKLHLPDDPAVLRRMLFAPAILLREVAGSADLKLYKRATARVYFRLARGQSVERVTQLVREHLARRGYGDIEVTQMSTVPPSVTPLDHPLMAATVGTYRELGVEPRLWPGFARTNTAALLDRPNTTFGLAHGGNQAVKDEYLLIEDRPPLYGLPTMMQSYARFLFAYGDALR